MLCMTRCEFWLNRPYNIRAINNKPCPRLKRTKISGGFQKALFKNNIRVKRTYNIIFLYFVAAITTTFSITIGAYLFCVYLNKLLSWICKLLRIMFLWRARKWIQPITREGKSSYVREFVDCRSATECSCTLQKYKNKKQCKKNQMKTLMIGREFCFSRPRQENRRIGWFEKKNETSHATLIYPHKF